jgi:hypothetical protein
METYFQLPSTLGLSIVWVSIYLSLWGSNLAPDTLAIFPGNSILHSAADSVTSAVQKASQALNERGERLGRAEEKTEDMKNSAQQFAETAHKVSQQRTGSSCWIIRGHNIKTLFPGWIRKSRSIFLVVVPFGASFSNY